MNTLRMNLGTVTVNPHTGLIRYAMHGLFIPQGKIKTPSQMDVAPWSYKWVDGIGWSPGGVRYRAPYGANNDVNNVNNP